jgi:hypothetical protein
LKWIATGEMKQMASSKGVSTLAVIQIQNIDGISSGMGQIALSEMNTTRFELGVIQIQSFGR